MNIRCAMYLHIFRGHNTVLEVLVITTVITIVTSTILLPLLLTTFLPRHDVEIFHLGGDGGGWGVLRGAEGEGDEGC